MCSVVISDAVVYISKRHNNLMSQFFCTNRQLTVFELIANLWDSELFNPIAPPLRCHSDFAMATACSNGQLVGLQPATPQKIADCLASMQSDLLKIIPKWKQSGQGKGGRDNREEEQEATTTTMMNNNKMNKRMTHSVRRSHRSPATIAGNRTASVLFRALMLLAP